MSCTGRPILQPSGCFADCNIE